MDEPHVSLRVRGGDIEELWRWLENPPGGWIRAASADGDADVAGWHRTKALRRAGGSREGATLFLDLDPAGVVRAVKSTPADGRVTERETLAALERALHEEVLRDAAPRLDLKVLPGGPPSEVWDAPPAVGRALLRVAMVRPYRTKMVDEHEPAIRDAATTADRAGWGPPEGPRAMFLDLRFSPDAAARMATAWRSDLPRRDGGG